MVAFFRASLPNSQRNIEKHLLQSETSEEDDEEEGDLKVSRIRRQTPNNNRKRSKDSEDFGGSWNPYTGICFYITIVKSSNIINTQINI